MVGDETTQGEVLITKIRKKPPTWSLEKVRDETGSIDKANLFKSSPRSPRGWILHLGKKAFKDFRTRRAAIDFFSRLVAIPDEGSVPGPTDDRAVPEAPTTERDAAITFTEAARKSQGHPVRGLLVSKNPRVFSHNDVDEDGAIIDVYTDGSNSNE
jgi:hypothetical protein